MSAAPPVSTAPVPPHLRALTRVLDHLTRATLWLAGATLVTMTVFVAWQVWSRYILGHSPVWTEAGAILLMSWFIFLGAAVGVRENFHMGFDVLLYVLPAGAKGWLNTISDLATGGFGLAMVIYGGQLMIDTWRTAIPVLGLPTGLGFVPVTFGGVLVAVFALERILRRMAGMDRQPAAPLITEV